MSNVHLLATLFVVAVVLSPTTYAAVFYRQSRAPCPTITTKSDFNYVPYAGLWYEIERFPNPFQQGTFCERAYYQEIAPGVISVQNTGVKPDGNLTSITGYATVIPEDPGHLILSFPDTPDGDYYVLDTDYTTYSAVYSCGNIGPVKIEYAWLLAREQTMSEADMEIALSKFTQFGIDVSQFIPTLQGETCVYYPEYPTI
uniref:Apolipoprotein D n=1 Tax=Daphnia galeata TaxID=27404 RepID=A0A8J2W555_9CRUS|nr:unnamed protein product [Daphnia galeata]